MTPKVILVGLPGSGKSTTGRRLAKILAVPFADSDDLVETADGRAVTAIFAESGETAFRAAEADAIVGALVGFDGVLSLGGGALGSAAVREAIRASGVPVVQLRAGSDTLHVRIGDGSSRPLLAADPDGRLAQLTAERAPVYESMSTFAVDTDERTPGQVAATVAARLHDLRRRDA